MNPVLSWALLVFLVTCSAFYSAAEIAYATASKPRLKTLSENGDRRAILAEYINDHYVRALSTILVADNLVNVATTSILTLLFVQVYLPESSNAETFAELASTAILLVFGEILPKTLATDNANAFVLRFARPLRFSMKLFSPVVAAVSRLVEKVSVLWTPKNAEPSMTDEELQMVVDSIREEGLFTESEGELIKSAIGFSEVTARDILVPRVEIEAYDLDTPLAELLKNPAAMSFSRIPVYRENIDHIIGILPTKQLMKALLSAEKPEAFSLEELLIPPLFVHMTKPADDILREFRKTKLHMAIVLDEYGGTMGLLTIEDILEEIVGEIYDEKDNVEEDCTETEQGIYLLNGSMNLYDAFEQLDFEPKDLDSEYSTLSGWLTGLLDRFPEAGDEIRYENLCFTVLSVDGKLADEVRAVAEHPVED